MEKAIKNIKMVGLLGVLILTFNSQASDLTIPNQFTSGTRAVAADVNANFDAAATSVTDNQTQITDLIAQITALTATVNANSETITANSVTIASLETENTNLQAEVDALQADSVAGLSAVLSVTTDNQDNAVAIFSSVNLHVNNGTEDTSIINGLGNLIVGYDEGVSGSSLFTCSYGLYTNQTDCEANGYIWANIHKSGSHNLVIGRFHDYSQYSGIVSGEINDISGIASSVLGGRDNKATGDYSTISGGSSNTASGLRSSISAGTSNTASGPTSSVSGGVNNESQGEFASILGGNSNTASSRQSSVSGGSDNTASGERSNVSGGIRNIASGSNSSVSGGSSREATGTFDWVAGSLFEDN